jgi:hypothetical protein
MNHANPHNLLTPLSYKQQCAGRHGRSHPLRPLRRAPRQQPPLGNLTLRLRMRYNDVNPAAHHGPRRHFPTMHHIIFHPSLLFL